MRLGATLVHLSGGPQYETVPWARRLEAAGFESLWTPQTVGRGAFVPDPLVTLAAAAAAPRDVELGTATLQLPLYHPADVAFRLLSLMTICGDRLTLGVSPGSTATDYAAFDRDFGTRFAVFRRDVDRLRVLLERGRDDLVDLGPALGRPPLLLGSWGANVERAAREFDGWLVTASRRTFDQIVEAYERFRAAGGKRAIVCTVPVDRGDDLDATGDLLRRYAEIGFDDAVVLIGPDGPAPEDVRALLPRSEASPVV